jgi:type I restriction enzyme, R subunit
VRNDRAGATDIGRRTADHAARPAYAPIIAGRFQWHHWAAPKLNGQLDHNAALTGDDLVRFVDTELFPHLARFHDHATGPDTIEYKIGEVFTELRSKFRSGYILRDVLEIVDGLQFNSQADKHELSALYETRIRRRANADTYAYFGEPVYVYSLREGIEDGFLTPFKVRQMASTIDEYVWDGTDEVLSGEVEKDRYTESDFNTRLIIEERERSRVAEFMGQIDQRQKTLVFCATQEHAGRVRDYINQIKASASPDYCHRVTADDGKLGEQHLRDFQDNAKTVPTILTTSQKLSTGVDARNVRNFVLMRPVRSMIEFKQIIGRGTRTYDGKDYFTIYDFVKAHENFNDPEWDGEPLPPEEPPEPRVPGQPRPEPPEPPEPPAGGDEGGEGRTKLIIRLADGKDREIQYLGTTTYWGPDGKPISAQQFLERLFGDLAGLVVDEDELRRQWSDPERRERFVTVLQEKGYDAEKLGEMRLLANAPNSDLFDVLAFVRFNLKPFTRTDRADKVREGGLHGQPAEMGAFLLAILNSYENSGESELALGKLKNHLVARYGTIADAKRVLGDIGTVKAAYLDMQAGLYRN